MTRNVYTYIDYIRKYVLNIASQARSNGVRTTLQWEHALSLPDTLYLYTYKYKTMHIMK